jgi:hypothetical protein
MDIAHKINWMERAGGSVGCEAGANPHAALAYMAFPSNLRDSILCLPLSFSLNFTFSSFTCLISCACFRKDEYGGQLFGAFDLSATAEDAGQSIRIDVGFYIDRLRQSPLGLSKSVYTIERAHRNTRISVCRSLSM